MLPLALILAKDTRDQLALVSMVLLQVFAAVCFFGVARYALPRLQARQLIDHDHPPTPIMVRGPMGWLFTVCVLELIFLQSAWYVILVLVGIIGVLLENGRTLTEQFGLARVRPLRLLSWSLFGFGAIMLVETPLTQAVMWLLDFIHMPHPVQESVTTFQQYKSVGAILAFIFQAAIIFPIIEELFFRGFLQTYLKGYTSTWGALILSSGVFAFAHANFGAVLPLWVLGLFLGLVYEHTGTLLLPIGIHACWNLMTALNLLVDKGASG